MKKLAPLFLVAIVAACSSSGSQESSGTGGTGGVMRESSVGSGPNGPSSSGVGPSSGTGGATSGTTGPSGPSGSSTTTSTSGAGGASVGAGGSSGAGGDPYNTPVMCSSNKMYSSGNNLDMHPGVGCKTCHVLLGQATGKTFDIGGTVYPTAHEPDDCDGVTVSGAQVIITDAQGVDHPLDVSPGSGNFHHQDFFGLQAFTVPYKARVVYNGKTRSMSASQTNGDCNSCHTEKGANNAPGRILLP